MTNMFSAIRNFLLETPFVTPKLLNTIPFLPPVPEGTQIKKSTTESFNAAFRQVQQGHIIIQVFAVGAIYWQHSLTRPDTYVFVLRGCVCQKMQCYEVQNNAKDGAVCEYLYVIIWP